MKKKEVALLMKKFWLYGVLPSGVCAVVALVIILAGSVFGTLFLAVALAPVLFGLFSFYMKAKKMEANACIKCPSPKQTEVTEDIRLPDETIDGVLCEVHQVTHTCQDCGTEYICTEYKRIKKTNQ